MRNKKILRSEDVGSYPDSPMFNFDSLFTVAVELPSGYLFSDLGSRGSGEFGYLVVVGAVPP